MKGSNESNIWQYCNVQGKSGTTEATNTAQTRTHVYTCNFISQTLKTWQYCPMKDNPADLVTKEHRCNYLVSAVFVNPIKYSYQPLYQGACLSINFQLP